MSNFIYLTDTHIGANPMGYYQQVPYPERIAAIIDALDRWLRDHRDVDFVLHGGDLVDFTSTANIDLAAELFNRLPIPTYLCLGNHDLTEENSVEIWIKCGACFFPENNPCHTIEKKDYAVHIMPSHWCASPFYWNRKGQIVNFTKDQMNRLESSLRNNSDKIQILLTHNPVFGIPTAQTGFEKPHHAPDEAFTNTITAIVKRHPSLKVVLGAHNHMNMRLTNAGAEFVTASSFSEAPFDFKYFQIDEDGISMSTISLIGEVGFDVDYDFDKTFVQGRECDRRF